MNLNVPIIDDIICILTIVRKLIVLRMSVRIITENCRVVRQTQNVSFVKNLFYVTVQYMIHRYSYTNTSYFNRLLI